MKYHALEESLQREEVGIQYYRAKYRIWSIKHKTYGMPHKVRTPSRAQGIPHDEESIQHAA